jgi:N-dimethylarginine dimethylaminohydrolase
MCAPLRRVLVKRPDAAFAVQDPARWHYSSRPDLAISQQEHDGLVRIMQQAEVEILYHNEPMPDHADAIFVYDPALITDAGAIILRMGKDLRRGEEEYMAHRLESLGIPILYRLHGNAQAEGGDLLWLDHDTLAVGLGFRTNTAGLAQLTEALGPLDVSLIPVELPYYHGPEACLHLLSLISIVDYDLAVVYPPLMSVPFWQLLQEHSFRFVEAPPEEFATMGPNVLALAPGKCVMLEGNPVTQQRLIAAGCEVWTYQGKELSLKAEGGPTCLTRPILREA